MNAPAPETLICEIFGVDIIAEFYTNASKKFDHDKNKKSLKITKKSILGLTKSQKNDRLSLSTRQQQIKTARVGRSAAGVTNLYISKTMENNTNTVGVARAIGVLAALIAKANNQLRADDVGQLITQYTLDALACGDVQENLECTIANFEMFDTEIVKVSVTNEEAFIKAINDLTHKLYGEDNELDCTDYVTLHNGHYDVAVQAFFNKETDFHTVVAYDINEENLIIAYTERF